MSLTSINGMSGCAIYFIPQLNCAIISDEFYGISVFEVGGFNMNILLCSKIALINSYK